MAYKNMKSNKAHIAELWEDKDNWRNKKTESRKMSIRMSKKHHK